MNFIRHQLPRTVSNGCSKVKWKIKVYKITEKQKLRTALIVAFVILQILLQLNTNLAFGEPKVQVATKKIVLFLLMIDITLSFLKKKKNICYDMYMYGK